ncbi:MAG: membrane-bound lytic murein transglycosylase MltF [Casimicrobiaceae bacterium]
MRTARILQSLVAATVLLTACGPTPAPPAPPANDLVALMRPGSATWSVGPDAQHAGFDHDLAQLFAKHQRLTLKLVAASDPVAGIRAKGSRAAMAAGGVYRAQSGVPQLSGQDLIYSTGYYAVEPVLIYNVDNFKPASWADLAGMTVGVLEGSGLAAVLTRIRADHPDVNWQEMALPSAQALIGQVSDGALEYAVVAASDAEAVRNVHLNFERAFAVAKKQELVWAFPAAQSVLRDQVDAFFATLRRDGTLQRLVERYFTYAQVPRLDAGAFHERSKALLPEYRPLFQHAQEATGVEWRLLAAMAYQESQWDPQAVSETGVRGLMQLTEDTARHLGAVDRLDPQSSVMAAARYLRKLKEKLPTRIAEPDRTWLALAAYNIGIGHLEDARVLAQKQKLSPDSWQAVKQALPLLALPEYYEDAKYGYARGGMPVAFVDRVRAYYDILLAQQPPLRPKLRMFSTAGDLPATRVDVPTLGNK